MKRNRKEKLVAIDNREKLQTGSNDRHFAEGHQH